MTLRILVNFVAAVENIQEGQAGGKEFPITKAETERSRRSRSRTMRRKGEKKKLGRLRCDPGAESLGAAAGELDARRPGDRMGLGGRGGVGDGVHLERALAV